MLRRHKVNEVESKNRDEFDNLSQISSSASYDYVDADDFYGNGGISSEHSLSFSSEPSRLEETIKEPEPKEETLPSVNTDKDQDIEEKHDNNYEEFLSFKAMQKVLNDKIEATIAKISIEISEQTIEFKDHEYQMKNALKEFQIRVFNKIDLVKNELNEKQEKTLNDLRNTISSLKAEIKILKKQLSKQVETQVSPNQRTTSTNTESTPINNTFPDQKSFITNKHREEDPNQNSELYEPAISDEEENSHGPNSNVYLNPAVEQNAQWSHLNKEEESFRRHPNVNSESVSVRDKFNPRGSILMHSDSTLRGIIQKKFSLDKYVNKQYIPGGTDEMIEHLENMSSEGDYEYVVIHSGTNDIR